MRRARFFRRNAVAGVPALAFLFALALPALARGPESQPPAPGYLQFGQPNQAQGRQILDDFRRQGLRGDYYLQFVLRVLPRRGPERDLHGSLWGSRNADGPVTRVDIQPAKAGEAGVKLLVQNGPKPAVWQWDGHRDSPPEKLGTKALFQPIAGTVVTPFDLQQPFLYWQDFDFEGITRMHGRPAYRFLLRPPPDLATRHPELSGVRIYLDTQYDALVQANLLGPDGQSRKSFSLLDLKKIGDQWLVKSVDVLNEVTRDKTRLEFTAAALNLDFPASIFTPAGLTHPAPVPGSLANL